MHRNATIPDYRSLFTQTSGMNICQIGYDICVFDRLRGLGIDIIGRIHFDNRDRFSISMGCIGKATEPCQQTAEWLLTSDFWLFLGPWHARWYEYEMLLLRVQTTYLIYDLENERWLFGDMIDHVGIYGSRVAESLSTFNVGLVTLAIVFNTSTQNLCRWKTIRHYILHTTINSIYSSRTVPCMLQVLISIDNTYLNGILAVMGWW